MQAKIFVGDEKELNHILENFSKKHEIIDVKLQNNSDTTELVILILFK